MIEIQLLLSAGYATLIFDSHSTLSPAFEVISQYLSHLRETSHIQSDVFGHIHSIYLCVQVKKNAMAKEAHVAQKVALVALRKNEAEVTKAEMSRVLHDLERERAEARADLKIELQARFLRARRVT